jgi:hypothetical protein
MTSAGRLAAAAALSVAAMVSAAGQTPAPDSRAVTSGHQRMLRALQQVADEADQRNLYFGGAAAEAARARLAALPAAAPALQRWIARVNLAEAEMRLGHVAEAIAQLTAARELLTSAGAPPGGPQMASTLFQLGIAFLRLGETENCTARHTPTSCILPLRGESLHADQNPSRQAIAAFTAGLAASPNPRLALSLRWLLNIAYMTIGGYPDQVPEALRIPQRAFDAGEPFPRFGNMAPALGLDIFDNAGGAVADDFDGDGHLDIVVSSMDPRSQMRLFVNDRAGGFSDRTGPAGLTGLVGGLNMIQADYDNDGDVDLLVLRGAWLDAGGRDPNSLLRNNGNGTFTDVTFDAGLAAINYPTQTASWGDYDNDGDLDVYIGNESSRTVAAPSQLFRNNGDGSFTDVAAAAGVLNSRFAKAVVWGDYDADRWPDLYVSNKGEPNRLYRNNQDGTFTDVAAQLAVDRPVQSFPAWFWDVNNDGALDLYVSAYSASIADLAAHALGQPIDIETARLYLGGKDGRFTEAAAAFGLAHPNAPMGSNFGDLDNDGYLDFYLGTGYPAVHEIMPNVMYWNRGGRRFAEVSYAGGFAHLQKGHGVAFADLDHDGDQDVFEQMGGAYPVDRAANVLYENPGFGNHWMTIQLVGRRSNRSAIGARIRAEIVENGARRSVYRHVNSGGTFGGNPLRQTIGLGQASRAELLEVSWPTSGITQTFRNVPADRAIRIIEGERSFDPLELKRVRLAR